MSRRRVEEQQAPAWSTQTKAEETAKATRNRLRRVLPRHVEVLPPKLANIIRERLRD